MVAVESPVRAVGCRLQGGPGAGVGLQAVAGAVAHGVGCFLRGHAANVECMAGSVVDLQVRGVGRGRGWGGGRGKG